MRTLTIVQNLGDRPRAHAGQELARHHQRHVDLDLYRDMASSRRTPARSGG